MDKIDGFTNGYPQRHRDADTFGGTDRNDDAAGTETAVEADRADPFNVYINNSVWHL
jgi:hypothetical protein